MKVVRCLYEVTAPLDDLTDQETLDQDFGGSIRAFMTWLEGEEGVHFLMANYPESVKRVTTVAFEEEAK